MRRFIARFVADDSGHTAIEYGLIAALVFLVLLSAFTAFSSKATSIFNAAMNAVSGSIA